MIKGAYRRFKKMSRKKKIAIGAGAAGLAGLATALAVPRSRAFLAKHAGAAYRGGKHYGKAGYEGAKGYAKSGYAKVRGLFKRKEA